MDCKTHALLPGMYIVRWSKVPGEGEQLAIAVAPGTEGVVDFFFSEHVSNNTLVRQDDCVVVRVSKARSALLFIQNGPRDNRTSIRVDRIGEAAVLQRNLDASEQPESQAKRKPEVLVLSGHIELQGDVIANEQGWLGNPLGSKRIEAISVSWPDKPEGVELAYSVQVKGLGRSPVVTSGKPAGTRGRALPITGVTLSLVGEKAALYRLDGAAVFSGRAKVSIESGIECSGPAGSEHLVALRVLISRSG